MRQKAWRRTAGLLLAAVLTATTVQPVLADKNTSGKTGSVSWSFGRVSQRPRMKPVCSYMMSYW